MKILIFSVVIFVSVLSGCHSHAPGNADHHDESTVKLIGYSAEFEVFAEAEPFVKGSESNILSHLSHIPDFRALEKGVVTIRLIINGRVVSQTLNAPVRKGIYQFSLTPVMAGTGKILYEIRRDSNIYRIGISPVTVYNTEEEADLAAESIVFPETNTTVFTKEQSWKIDFATGLPIVQPFGQVIKTTAQVMSAPGDEMIIPAKAPGIVVFAANNLTDGMLVNSGQTLFSVAGNGLPSDNATLQFLEIKNNYEKAKADFNRASELAGDKIIATKDLLQVKNLYENARMAYEQMNKTFSMNGQRIKSPLKGFIRQILVQNGQSVEAGQALAVVSQNKSLLIRADVQQKYAPLLTGIKSAGIHTLHNQKTYSLDDLHGKIISIGKVANETDYLIPVTLQIDNTGDFIAGGFAELYLSTITNNRALTIPNTALLEEQGIFFVFVQIHPELFEKREVKTGVTDGIYTEIISGISSEDRIVFRGAVMIKLAQSSGALDAHSGHVH